MVLPLLMKPARQSSCPSHTQTRRQKAKAVPQSEAQRVAPAAAAALAKESAAPTGVAAADQAECPPHPRPHVPRDVQAGASTSLVRHSLSLGQGRDASVGEWYGWDICIEQGRRCMHLIQGAGGSPRGVWQLPLSRRHTHHTRTRMRRLGHLSVKIVHTESRNSSRFGSSPIKKSLCQASSASLGSATSPAQDAAVGDVAVDAHCDLALLCCA
jgi:hypothetical protein